MLAINTEYRKSILFIRLVGNLNNDTVFVLEEELNKWLGEGINKIVFNMNSLLGIDSTGINSLLKFSHIINTKNGYSLICGINKHINRHLKSSSVLNYIYEISDELNAIKVMKWRQES